MSGFHSSGLWTMTFHCWAHRATARNVRFGPLPPMVIGGCGVCTAFGSQYASVSLMYLPSKFATFSVSSAMIACVPSSNRSKRSFSG